MVDYFAEAVKYFRKKKAGRMPFEEKMGEAAGIESVKPPPVVKPEAEKKLKDKSTGGSSPFTNGEIRRGYRKL